VDNRAIAHELSNELMIIRGTAELAAHRVPSDDPLARDIQSIIEAAEDAIWVVHALKANVRDQRWPKWWARGRA
jgi:signal transduction histidine kinase